MPGPAPGVLSDRASVVSNFGKYPTDRINHFVLGLPLGFLGPGLYSECMYQQFITKVEMGRLRSTPRSSSFRESAVRLSDSMITIGIEVVQSTSPSILICAPKKSPIVGRMRNDRGNSGQFPAKIGFSIPMTY